MTKYRIKIKKTFFLTYLLQFFFFKENVKKNFFLVRNSTLFYNFKENTKKLLVGVFDNLHLPFI